MQDTLTPWSRAVAVAVGLSVVVGVLVTAFAWPTSQTAPREVPIALAAPAPVAAAITAALDEARPGAFDINMVVDDAAARNAIESREAYGAIVVGLDGPAVLTAPAGSPVVAQLLDAVADTLGAQLAGVDGAAPATPVPPVVVEQVVPLPAGDPRGAVLAAGVLPLVLGSIGFGAVGTFIVRGAGRRLAYLGVGAVVSGVLVTAILGPWLDVLTGPFWAQAGVAALGLAAGGAGILGLSSLLGRAGLALGAATVMVLGNPLSGAASAPELLPPGWSALGQALPPGAMFTALRSVAYFDGAGATAALGTLVTWTVVGSVFIVLGARVHARRADVRV